MSHKKFSWIRDGSCIRPVNRHFNNKGYPVFFREGKRRYVSRYILERKHGNLPREIVTRHTCDNPWCINPDHLVPGTMLDNMHDMIKRGRARHAKGQDHARAKLSDQDIEQIRSMTGTTRQIGKQFGINSGYVSRLRRGLMRPMEERSG